jgi:hypothetical protein
MTEKDKEFGEIIGQVYVSYRKPNHYFRMFQGFGISTKILNQLNLEGVKIVKIIYKGVKEMVYKVPLSDYLNSNKKFVFQDKFNRFGGELDEQKFISVKDMQEVKNE